MVTIMAELRHEVMLTIGSTGGATPLWYTRVNVLVMGRVPNFRVGLNLLPLVTFSITALLRLPVKVETALGSEIGNLFIVLPILTLRSLDRVECSGPSKVLTLLLDYTTALPLPRCNPGITTVDTPNTPPRPARSVPHLASATADAE